MDLNEIKNAIEKSKFISIDLEFTGIGRTSTQFFDSMQDRYEQIRMSVVDHIVNQVGITCWTHDSLDDCWIPVTFSIYVKPNSGSYFTSSINSLEFLSRNNFDFNAWIKTAVPYYDILPCVYEDDITTGEDQVFVDQTVSKLEEFILTNNTEIRIETTNSAQRRLVHISTRKFENLSSSRSEPGFIVVAKSVQKDETIPGFKNVIQMVSDAKVPLIGHNMSLDMAHIINRFVARLPYSVKEYKKLISTTFPILFDTKLIAQSSTTLKQFKIKSGLSSLYEYVKVSKFPVIKIPESVEQFHDAGYDAQCTGFAFLKLIGILKKVVTAETMDDSLNILDTENIVKVSRHDTVDNNFDLNIVQEFRNCINFSFAPVDRFRIDQDQEMTFNEFYIITSRDDLMKLKESKFDIRWFGRDPWIVKQSGDQIEFELFMTENEIEFTQKNEMGVVDVPVELSSTNNKRARVDYSDI